METKADFSRVYVVLYVVGLALILGAFYLLVAPEHRTHIAWLDLAAVSAVFTIDFAFFSLASIGTRSFERRIAGLGILSTTAVLYSLLAIALVIVGRAQLLTFRQQLVGHLVLLFGVVIAAAVARTSILHASEVAGEEKAIRSSLDSLKADIALCEADMVTLPTLPDMIRNRLLRLKEEARYLSPSRDQTALSYEQKMLLLIDSVRSQLANAASLPVAEITADLDQFDALMALRKKALN